MKYFIKLILVFLLMSSCAEEVIKRPDNLIDKNTMINVYYDMALYRELQSSSVAIPGMEKTRDVMDFIFKKYSLDSLQFVKSDIYYASIPSEYEAMYEVVESRFISQKEELEEENGKRELSTGKKNKVKSRTDAKDSLPKNTKPVPLKKGDSI